MRKKYFISFLIQIFCWSSVTEAGDLTFIDSIPLGITYSVYADSQYAYVTNNEGLAIILLDPPEKPRLAGSLKVGVSLILERLLTA